MKTIKKLICVSLYYNIMTSKGVKAMRKLTVKEYLEQEPISLTELYIQAQLGLLICKEAKKLHEKARGKP